MAVVGTTSAIIGLATDIIKTGSKLYIFCKRYENLDGHFAEIGKDLRNLENDTLRVGGLSSIASNDASFENELSKLKLILAECQKFMEEWAKKIEHLGVGDSKRGRAVVRKMKNVLLADVEYFRGIREEISSYRGRINTSLNILEITVGFHSHILSQNMDRKLQTLLEQRNSFQEDTAANIMDLTSKIEASSIAQNQSCLNLGSMAHRDEIHYKKTNDAIEAVDARLRNIQKKLEVSMRRPPVPRKRRTRMSFQPQIDHKCEMDQGDKTPAEQPRAQVIRIVKPEWRIQENNGRFDLSLVAIDDPQYLNANFQQRLNMVDKIKSMRLIIWLLRAQGFTSKLKIYSAQRETSLFSCFQDPVEAMSRILVPSHAFGYMTIKKLRRRIESRIQRWSNDTTRIELDCGLPKLIKVDVTTAYLFRAQSYADARYQSSCDKNGNPIPFSTENPVLGIPLQILDSLQDQYSNYVKDFVQSEIYLQQYARIEYIGTYSKVSGCLLQILCNWYITSKSIGQECTMLRDGIETHIVFSLLDRTFILNRNLYANTQHRQYTIPNLVQSQLKYLFFQNQQQRIHSIFKGWEESINKIHTPNLTCWITDFCVFCILCLIIDMAITSVWLFHSHRKETSHETNDREAQELIGIIEEKLFRKSKELFHLRYRTRKGGRESFNPLRDDIGPRNLEGGNWRSEFIQEIRDLIAMLLIEQNTLGICEKTPYEHPGRLISIFLKDFL